MRSRSRAGLKWFAQLVEGGDHRYLPPPISERNITSLLFSPRADGWRGEGWLHGIESISVKRTKVPTTALTFSLATVRGLWQCRLHVQTTKLKEVEEEDTLASLPTSGTARGIVYAQKKGPPLLPQLAHIRALSFFASATRRSLRRIFPEADFGTLGTNSIRAGRNCL